MLGIVIFSNQHGPGRQRTQEAMRAEVRDIVARFDDFASFCGVPLQIFVAAARGDALLCWLGMGNKSYLDPKSM